jgi:hypothetical protein
MLFILFISGSGKGIDDVEVDGIETLLGCGIVVVLLCC